MKKIIFTLLITMLAMPVLQAQNEANWWYFGYGVGLNFNLMLTKKGVEVPSPASGPISSIEACAVMSDKNGNLLMATDGVTVYNNRDGDVMDNGTNLYSDKSSTQGAIIFPAPGKSNMFYIATAGEVTTVNPSRGVNYSLVDMSANGGRGKVITKNVNLLSSVYSYENITAVAHSNGKDYWLVHREKDLMYVWAVTGTGISKAKIYTIPGLVLDPRNGGDYTGYLKFSVDGSKFAAALSSNFVLVYGDFDPSTGIMNTKPAFKSYHSYYNVEFSPSGEYVYIANRTCWYRIKFSDLGIKDTEEICYNLSGRYEGINNFQLGPDGKIYAIVNATSNSSHILGVITNPDEGGSDFVFIDDYLVGGYSSFGLPNFVAGYLKPKVLPVSSICQASSNFKFKYTLPTDVTGITAIEWSFGDGTTPIKQTTTAGTTVVSQAHQYTSNGTYTIKVTLLKGSSRISSTNITKANVVDCDIKTNPIIRQDLSNKEF